MHPRTVRGRGRYANVVTYDPFDPAPIRKAMELVDRRVAAARRGLRERELPALVQRESLRDVPLACPQHLFVRPDAAGPARHSRQVRAGGAAAVADGGVRRRVAAHQAGHRRAARSRDGPRHRQREAVRRRVRRPEHQRIRRMVGLAGRIRAREDRRADRRARGVDSARRARVCARAVRASPSATAATSRR